MIKTVDEVVKKVLVDLGIEEEQLVENARLRDGLGLDSTELVDVSLAIQKELGVSVKFQSNKDLTLQELYQSVQQQQNL